MTFRKGIKLSLESIDFQTGQVLYLELIEAYKALRKLPAAKIPDSKEAEMISKIINNHTKMKIAMSFGEQGPGLHLPAVNKNNPLVSSILRGMTSSATGLSLVNAAGGLLRGGVNLRTSQVSGIFTEIETILEFPVAMLTTNEFSDEELAAITLHEAGHLWTYFEYMSVAVTTNAVLTGLSQAYGGNQTFDERESILLSVHKALSLGDKGVSELAKSTNKTVVEAVVLSNVMQKSTSELGSNIYDMTSWEYLSDQFAARHGAGRALVTALDKMMNSIFTPSYRNAAVFMAIEAFKIFVVFGSLLALSVMPLISIMLVTQPGKELYDKPEARFQRLRNQIIEASKDKKISADARERLHADLGLIDDVITHVNDRRDFFTVLWHTFSPQYRKQWASEKLQKDLEQIAASDLFDRAAQLKDLA